MRAGSQATGQANWVAVPVGVPAKEWKPGTYGLVHAHAMLYTRRGPRQPHNTHPGPDPDHNWIGFATRAQPDIYTGPSCLSVACR